MDMSRSEIAAPRRRKVGPFSAIEFPAPAGAPAVVFFHGYGANGADLAPLASELGLEKPARWLFPDAPLSLDFGGLAWFQIDVAAVEQAQRTGKAVDWSDREPPGFEEAAAAAEEFLAALETPLENVVLGGFSQGAMLAVELALRAKSAPRGLVVLSGNLIRRKAWAALAPRRAGMKFFQSHGIADPILGFQGALKLEALLKDAGLAGSMLKFEGGHAIPLEAAESLAQWLNAL